MSGNPKDNLKLWQTMCSSTIGAMITSITVTPLDIIKIRLQVQNKPPGYCFLYCNGLSDHLCLNVNGNCNSDKWYKRPGDFTNSFDAFRKIVRNEGVFTLWSGLSPTLIMAVPQVIIYYTLNDYLKNAVGYKSFQNNYSSSKFKKEDLFPPICGAVARFVAQSVIAPLELIRTKMQSKKMSIIQTKTIVTEAIKQSGVSILWRGMGPTMWRDVPYTMCLWFTYEYLKKSYIQNYSQNGIVPNYIVFGCSTIGGFVAGMLTHPFDVAKTHRQVELGEAIVHNKRISSSWSYLKKLREKQGSLSLYSGLGPRIVRVCFATSLMITTFEFINNKFIQYNQRHCTQQ